MPEWFWGIKTIALFDVWSIEQLLSGVSIGSLVIYENRVRIAELLENKKHRDHSIYFDLIGVLFLAFTWESFEHYLEAGLAGREVQYWFQGVEFWGNRLITDPMLLVIGWWIARLYPWSVGYARYMSAIWLITHIAIFPHSMYLHEWIV